MCGAHPAGRPLEPTTSNEDYGDGRKTHVLLRCRASASWENECCARATVAFLHGVCRRPCRAYARTARIVICTAYGHVVFTVMERSCAGGGSDPREGRSPSRADPELSLLPRLPSLPEAEDGGCPKAAVWCAEHDQATLTLRFPHHFRPCFPQSYKRSKMFQKA